MRLSRDLVALVAATFIIRSFATPVENANDKYYYGYPSETTPNCNEPKTGTRPLCWDELKVEQAINQFFTIWSQAIDCITQHNQTIIYDAAKPTGTNFSPNVVVNIDTIFQTLIDLSFPYPLLQPYPQNTALSQMLELYQPNEHYLYLNHGEHGELVGLLNPEIPLLMQKRLTDILKHVQSDLEFFTIMAGHGAFTMPPRSDMPEVTGVQAFGLV
ncbi:MAG: hypothetical protein Q9192_006892, partial [Flavoplaca navasiana]